MTAPKSLPAAPSLASLRKQAKKLRRELEAGQPDAIARARSQLPAAKPPLPLRDAQLVLAREYGFEGWQALTAEVARRAGRTLPWAAGQARRAIHAGDVEQLSQLVAAHPALGSYRDAAGATLLTFAAEAFGRSGDAEREQVFTRPACAELLLQHGARVDPELWQNVLMMRARGMLQLLSSDRALPDTLRIHAALGELERTRAATGAAARGELHEACMDALAFGHPDVAELLLERCIELEPAFGERIARGPGRSAFLACLAEHDDRFGVNGDLWQSFAVIQAKGAIDAGDTAAFEALLQREPGLLASAAEAVQVELIEYATYTGRGAFIGALLDAQPALLQRRPPPPSAAIEHAFEYGHADYIPLLTRIWPLPDDLPHAAGSGDFERVKRWFDANGRPVLGDHRHYPIDNPRKLDHLHWSPGEAQHVLDCALAWACLNHHFEIASFLLERGADIDTDWSTHEPAGILHECAIQRNYAAARFVIERGIDLTLTDYRWNATAEGWARHAANDPAMVTLIAEAARARSRSSGSETS